MVNCIIVHGCPHREDDSPQTRTYDKHWMPWLKRELERRGIPTAIPLMPTPWKPDYDGFKEEFEKCEVSDDTILIGHSCGCAFLVRWLGETKRRAMKLILVAPWKRTYEDELKKRYYGFSIDHSISSRVGEIVIFTADNEAQEGKDGLRLYHDALGGRVIELPGRGHYIMKHMGTEEFPELVEVVLGSHSSRAC